MASYQTRNLLPLAVRRTTMELVNLVMSEKVFRDDGSFETIEDYVETRARVITLTSSEIQRLRENGITINSGFSISIIGELATVPDYILLVGSQVLRVVSYTFEAGVSIMLADALPGVTD